MLAIQDILIAKGTDVSYAGRLDGDGKTGFDNSLGASTSDKNHPSNTRGNNEAPKTAS